MCVFLFPLAMCIVVTGFYSFKSNAHAKRLAAESISSVAAQLRFYPLGIMITMSPISAFFIIVVITGHEVHALLAVGALLVSSIGTVNAVVYTTIIYRPTTAVPQFKVIVETSLNEVMSSAMNPDSHDLEKISDVVSATSGSFAINYKVDFYD
jgi:hypothetical protein